MKEAELALKASVVSLDLAQKTLAADQRKFELGAETNFFVLDSQERLAQAELIHLQSQVNYQVALAAVGHATGRLLAPYRLQIEAASKEPAIVNPDWACVRTNGQKMIDIEICVDSVESAIAAGLGGARRIELCCALSEGGITPSSGLIQTVREMVTLDLFVIVRPRGGNFTYSPKEFEVMSRDIRIAQSLGVNGVVFGLLTSDGLVDRDRTRLLVEAARPLEVTFHRAFDACRDLDKALEDVIWCGATRLLTSGGCADAVRGTSRIARLVKAAGSRIRIMAGGGVRASNVAAIVQGTGIRDVHTSLNPNRAMKREIETASPLTEMGISDPFIVTADDVRSFKSAVDSISVGAST